LAGGAEATFTQRLVDWVGSHVRAFAFFGGIVAHRPGDQIKPFLPGFIDADVSGEAVASPPPMAQQKAWAFTTIELVHLDRLLGPGSRIRSLDRLQPAHGVMRRRSDGSRAP
jgi:hypothetical protein